MTDQTLSFLPLSLSLFLSHSLSVSFVSLSLGPTYRLLSARDPRLGSRPYFRLKMDQTPASWTIMRALENRKTRNESSAVLFRFYKACPTGTAR